MSARLSITATISVGCLGLAGCVAAGADPAAGRAEAETIAQTTSVADDDAAVFYRGATWTEDFKPPLSAMVAHDDVLWLAGQLGFAPGGGLADGIEAQTRSALQAIEAILSQAGADRSDVIACTAYLVDMSDFAAFNAVYAGFFAEPYPARTTVGVAALPLGAAVEIACVAARPE